MLTNNNIISLRPMSTTVFYFFLPFFIFTFLNLLNYIYSNMYADKNQLLDLKLYKDTFTKHAWKRNTEKFYLFSGKPMRVTKLAWPHWQRRPLFA